MISKDLMSLLKDEDPVMGGHIFVRRASRRPQWVGRVPLHPNDWSGPTQPNASLGSGSDGGSPTQQTYQQNICFLGKKRLFSCKNPS